MTGSTKKRIAQSQWTRAGSLAIVDCYPQVARTCILRAFSSQMSCHLSLVLRLFCFGFVFVLSMKPRPFVQSFFDMQAPRQPHVFLPFFLLFLWKCRCFRVFFVLLPFALCMERDCVRFFFPFFLDIKFVGSTSRGHTGRGSYMILLPPSFCGACLNFSREKDSAIPFPRRP